MTINLNNYIYIVLINFAICIGAFLLYFGLNYIFDFKLIKKYASKITKNYKLVFDIVSGLIMGIISFLGIYYSYLQIPSTNTIILMYLPILLVIGISYKPSLFLTYLITILFSLITFAFVKNINFINLSIHVILTIITACFIVTISLLKLKSNKLINISFILIFIGIIILVFYLLIKNQKIINILIQSLFIFILYLICFFLGNYIQNWIIKINELNISSVFGAKNFYKQNVAINKINETKNKDHYGIMCLINFTNIYNLPIQLGNYMSNYMQQKLLDCFVETLKKFKPIFFITSKNEYAFYIPIKNINLNSINIAYNGNYEISRTKNDPFSQIEIYLKNIPTELIFNNQKINVKFQVTSSIYGLHSYDNIELLKKCRLSFKNTTTKMKNIIKLYNPNIDINFKVNYEEIKRLQRYFTPDNIEIKLIKHNNWYISYVSSINHLLFDFEDIKNYAKKHNIYTIMMRWIAMQSIQKFKNENYNLPLLIEYPLNYILSSNFNINSFQRKMNLMNINLNNIILKLNLNDINIQKDNNYLYKNLNSLIDLGIKIYFFNFDETYIDFIGYFKPNWISINNNFKKYFDYYQKLEILVSKFGINLI